MTTPGENIRIPCSPTRVMACDEGLWIIALCTELVVHDIVKVVRTPHLIGIVPGWVYCRLVRGSTVLSRSRLADLNESGGLPAPIPLFGIIVEHSDAKCGRRKVQFMSLSVSDPAR